MMLLVRDHFLFRLDNNDLLDNLSMSWTSSPLRICNHEDRVCNQAGHEDHAGQSMFQADRALNLLSCSQLGNSILLCNENL